jgi:hypothetical protein
MTIKNIVLRPSKSPNLLVAPSVYSSQYQDQLNNALRLYFNQVDNFTQAIAIPLSGITADRPLQSLQVPLAIGQTYFDTTLNRPIFWTGTQWIKADGSVV